MILSEFREQHAVKVRIRVQKGGQTYVAVLAYVMRDSAQILLAKFLDNENKWALYCRARADGEDTDERHLNIEVELWGPDTTDALTWMKGLVDAVAWGHRGSSKSGRENRSPRSYVLQSTPKGFRSQTRGEPLRAGRPAPSLLGSPHKQSVRVRKAHSKFFL